MIGAKGDGVGHGGTAALLNAVPAVSGHGKARRGAQQYNGDLVTLFQQQKLHAKLRRCMASARWRGSSRSAPAGPLTKVMS